MAITFQGAGALASSNTNGQTVTIPWPSGYSAVAKDVAVVVAVGRHAGPASVACPTPVAGVNFTLVASAFAPVGASDMDTTVFYKVLDGTETTVSFTNNATFSTTGNGVGYAMAVYRGLSDVNPIDAAGVASNTSGVTTWTPTGVTTTQYGTLVLSAVGSADDNTLGLDPGNEQGFAATDANPLLSFGFSGAGYNITPYSNDASIGLAGKVVGAEGAITMPTWRQNLSAGDFTASVSFALREANSASGSASGSGSAVRAALTQLNTATGSAVASGSVVSDISVLFSRTALGAGVGAGTVDIKIATKREALGEAFGSATLNATWRPNPGITPMTIDDSVLTGVELIDSVPALTPLTVDGLSVPVGPVFPQLFSGNPQPYNPGDPLPIRPAFVPFVYATFDNGVQLTNAFDVSWTDPLNGTGAGQLSIPADDPQVALLIPGCRIRCWIYGVAAFTFIVENAPETILTSQSEEFGEIIKVSGRGWVAEYDSARIYPWGGVNHPLNPQQRSWTFASPNYPNLNGWGSPVSQGEQRYVLSPRNVTKERKVIVGEVLKDPLGQIILDQVGDRVPGPNSSVYTETIPWPAPMDWQVPAAHWIWGTADSSIEGYNYFRGQFTLSDRQAVTIAATADNLYTIFLDGIPIMGDSENHLCWQEWKYIEVTLEAGTYTLGAVVINVPLSAAATLPPYPNIPGYVWIYDTTTQTWALVKIGGESAVGQPAGAFLGGPNRVIDGGGVVDGIYIPNGTFGPPFGGPFYTRLVNISTAWLNPAYDGTPIGGPASQNPAGFIAAVYDRDSLNRLRTIYFRSDGNLLRGFPLPPLDPQRYAWRVLGYPVLQPGWTVGQIVNDLLIESQSRGSLSGHTLGFTNGTDSDGDPWQGVQGGGSYIPGFSMAVGASLLNALDSLVDQGWIDYRMKAGVPQLEVFNQGAAGGVTSVTFTEGVNVLNLSVRQSPYIYDRLLVKWSGGFVNVGSTGREGYVTVNAQDKDEALRRGEVVLADIQNPDPSVLLEFEPIVGSQPYLDFSVGDYVTVTGLGSLRVMAITVDQDDMGNPNVSLELNKRWPAAQRAEYNLLQSLGEGSIGKIRSDPMVVGLPARIQI